MTVDQKSVKAMKILLLTAKPPFPLIDGGRIAVYEPLHRLVERGHQVTLLTFRSPGEYQAAFDHLRTLFRVEEISHNTRTRFSGMVGNLFSALPYTVSKYQSPLMVQKLRGVMTEGQFDVAHLEQVHMAGYQAITKGEFGLPTVLRQENVESHLAERYWQSQTGLRRIYAQLQAARLRRYEAEMCGRMDRCLAISSGDESRLKALSPEAKTTVIPAGVDVEDFRPAPHREEGDTLVFVGSMDWMPNVDAVGWFCADILPAVRQQVPGLQFYIVGKNPSDEIRKLAALDYIHVTGFVEDVQDYFARATVFIVPLRVGGGMRVKLLQAMSMAKPVVSTSIGAEGIRVADGENILFAENALDFAASVIRLLRDQPLRERLGQDARRLVKEDYSWEAATDLLELAYREVSNVSE